MGAGHLEGPVQQGGGGGLKKALRQQHYGQPVSQKWHRNHQASPRRTSRHTKIPTTFGQFGDDRYSELGVRELERQRDLSHTSRPQRDRKRAFGPRPTRPKPPRL